MSIDHGYTTQDGNNGPQDNVQPTPGLIYAQALGTKTLGGVWSAAKALVVPTVGTILGIVIHGKVQTYRANKAAAAIETD